jgi:hypothetical protein
MSSGVGSPSTGILEASMFVPNRRNYCNVPSPLQTPFGKDRNEVNRTLVGILAVELVLSKDYSSFVEGQPVAIAKTLFDKRGKLSADNLKIIYLILYIWHETLRRRIRP